MSSSESFKSQNEKVKESITILKKLQELGIPTNEPGYVMLKDKFNDWIKSNEPWKGEIYFPRFGREAQVNLPVDPGRVSTVNLLKPHM